MKRYYEKRDKLSNQRKIYYEKIEMCYLQNLKQTSKIETEKEKYINNKWRISIKSWKS